MLIPFHVCGKRKFHNQNTNCNHHGDMQNWRGYFGNSALRKSIYVMQVYRKFRTHAIVPDMLS
jgi:hypothetical protein